MSPSLSLSTAVRAFVCGLLASLASAVTIELPLLRAPPAVGDEGLRRLEDKPTGPDPSTCHIWQDCWKLTIPGAQLLSPICLILPPRFVRDLHTGRSGADVSMLRLARQTP